MNYDVFISYSSSDKQAVDLIYRYLTETAGLVCWRDKQNIQMGGDFTGEIPEGIDNAAVFLLVLSEGSQSSKWVRKEIVYAQSKKPIIPLKLSDFELNSDMAFLLGNVQILDLSKEMEGIEDVLKQELNQIRESPWYNAHAQELMALEQETNKKKAEKEAKKKKEEKKARSEAMAKALKKAVKDTAKKANDSLEKDLDLTTEEGAAKKLKRIKHRVIAFVIIAALLAGGGIFYWNYLHTIHLQDYIEITYTGVDGYGVPEYEILTDKFDHDYHNMKVLKELDCEAHTVLEDYAEIECSYSKDSELSNGDELEITITANRNAFRKETGYRLKYPATYTVTVDGLTDKQTFDPFSNIDLEGGLTGTNGYGTLDLTKKQTDGYWEVGEYIISGGENGKLSNGDTITITFNMDYENPEDMAVDYDGWYPDPVTMDFTVSGLSDAEEYDAFALIDPVGTGMDGEGKLDLQMDGELPDGLDFEVDPEGPYSNGQKVTISLVADSDKDVSEYMKSELGLSPKAVSMQYTISGLSSYITSISDIPEDLINAIKDQAVSDVETMVARNSDYIRSASPEAEYLGVYLLTAKNGADTDYHNMAAFVFKTTVNQILSDNTTRSFTYYWYMEYADLCVNGDGEVEQDLFDTLPMDNEVTDDVADSNLHPYKGYTSLQELKSEVVTKNKNVYNSYSNVEEKTGTVSSGSTKEKTE